MRARLLACLAASLAVGCSSEAPEARNMTVDEVAKELSSVQITPGQWETRSEVVNVTAPNLPREILNQMKRAPVTSRHCITPEQAAQPQANFLAMEGSDCAYQDFTMRNGRMQGKMTCSGGDEVTGEAVAQFEGQFGPESYDSRVTMEIQAPAETTLTIESRVVGRRIGDCPEGEAGG